MRKALIAASVIVASGFVMGAASADTYVKGYTKKDGTYVQPHYRSDPNSNKQDNFSTRGNTNPYTGKQGTKDPYGESRNSGSGYSNSYNLGGVGPNSRRRLGD